MTVKILSEIKKDNIYNAFVKGETKASLARKYNVSPDTIRRVIKEKKPAYYLTNRQKDNSKLKSYAKSLDSKPEVSCRVLSWTVSDNYITIIETTGDSHTVSKDNDSYKTIAEKLLNGKLEQALDLIQPAKGIEKFSEGELSIYNGKVTYKGLELDNGLTNRIISAMAQGKEFKFLARFLNNLMENPSYRAINELFGFLDHNDIELSEDGYFLAWKRVNSDYTDMYTGKIDNSPGKSPEVDRNQVDEDSDKTCSKGLHVAAKHYLPNYGSGRGIIIQVKVHPKDVVAIPKDYKNSKLRCCKYEVLKDVTKGFTHY